MYWIIPSFLAKISGVLDRLLLCCWSKSCLCCSCRIAYSLTVISETGPETPEQYSSAKRYFRCSPSIWKSLIRGSVSSSVAGFLNMIYLVTKWTVKQLLLLLSFGFSEFESNLHHCIEEENDDANCIDWHQNAHATRSWRGRWDDMRGSSHRWTHSGHRAGLSN